MTEEIRMSKRKQKVIPVALLPPGEEFVNGTFLAFTLGRGRVLDCTL